MKEAASISRLYGGIHYRNDIERGKEHGTRIGGYAVRFAQLREPRLLRRCGFPPKEPRLLDATPRVEEPTHRSREYRHPCRRQE